MIKKVKFFVFPLIILLLLTSVYPINTYAAKKYYIKITSPKNGTKLYQSFTRNGINNLIYAKWKSNAKSFIVTLKNIDTGDYLINKEKTYKKSIFTGLHYNFSSSYEGEYILEVSIANTKIKDSIKFKFIGQKIYPISHSASYCGKSTNSGVCKVKKYSSAFKKDLSNNKIYYDYIVYISKDDLEKMNDSSIEDYLDDYTKGELESAAVISVLQYTCPIAVPIAKLFSSASSIHDFSHALDKY